ncbi:CinA family protein [Bartonella tamiae]|uniref:Competence/damage-inducible protein CinA domain n=1 Tax=Bartonella tamiae Th239 TaxID=1094558 RepID=J1K008_9HYPH|nr:CinA family protein [Bartonella tamiae]EJF90727.1 competence/damage-inducible protein CinA domain [Bartonella tamiae Th239]EJF93896.1 competence/damage-inducible protein CinA domain [Bartonella tamiae Th307]
MSMIAEEKAMKVLAFCRNENMRLVTVESCTAGLIIASLTDISGSSDVVDCGFITYSNEAKSRLVAVSPILIETHGAVSREVAIAMAEGGLRHSTADITIAVTGIAGPKSDKTRKPVGLVHFAVARKNHRTRHKEENFGTLERAKIRQKTVERALDFICE